jgi:hypothetical protein
MRTLPTLCVCGSLVAPAALTALSALECISGEVAQTQQSGPPENNELNLLQKAPLFPGPTPPASSLPSDDWLNSLWLTSAGDVLSNYSLSRARDWQIRRRLLFSVAPVSPSGGKGDHWKSGEVDRLIGPQMELN